MLGNTIYLKFCQWVSTVKVSRLVKVRADRLDSTDIHDDIKAYVFHMEMNTKQQFARNGLSTSNHSIGSRPSVVRIVLSVPSGVRPF